MTQALAGRAGGTAESEGMRPQRDLIGRKPLLTGGSQRRTRAVARRRDSRLWPVLTPEAARVSPTGEPLRPRISRSGHEPSSQLDLEEP